MTPTFSNESAPLFEMSPRMESSLRMSGADVLYFAMGNFGLGFYQQRMTSLAVDRYPGETGSFYLFACNEFGDVIGNLWYSTIEEALADAERYCVVHSIQ